MYLSALNVYKDPFPYKNTFLSEPSSSFYVRTETTPRRLVFARLVFAWIIICRLNGVIRRNRRKFVSTKFVIFSYENILLCSHADWKRTNKWSRTCLKKSWKIHTWTIYNFAVIFAWNFTIIFKSSLLFNSFYRLVFSRFCDIRGLVFSRFFDIRGNLDSFYCLFCLWTELYDSATLKLDQLWNDQ